MQTDWGVVVATFVGPIVGVVIGIVLTRRLEYRRERLWVFRSLLATRAAILEPIHVQALNSIDVTFGGKGKGDRAVRDAWWNYLRHLTTQDQRIPANETNRQNLMVELLSRMADVLHFPADRDYLAQRSYYPQGWFDRLMMNTKAVHFAGEVLAGSRPLWITAAQPAVAGAAQAPQQPAPATPPGTLPPQAP